jgi:multicomponent Na+:H+ antiporter subunit G
MELLADIASGILIAAGAILSLIGALGILRLPDVFARMHGAGMIDTGGAGLILAGLMIQGGFSLVTLKLALILVFLLYTSPTTTHALARASLHGGLRPLTRDRGAGEEEPPAEDAAETERAPEQSPAEGETHVGGSEPSKT